MDVSEYISGERIQELADHTIIFQTQDHFNLAMTQLKNTRCKYTIIQNDEINEDIQKAKSIFVYTHGAHMFFNKILPKLNHPITLVSHNSDYHITNDYIQYVQTDKLVKWFAQNAHYENIKLIPIPIGIANSQWSHGNIALIEEIRQQNNPKENLVYKNFNVVTSPENRCHIDLQTAHNGILMNIPADNRTYLTDISKSLFCICPFGAGMDTHRVWEALYLNTIPIVPECSMFRSFNELPMLYITDWSIVTPTFLFTEYQKLIQQKYNSEKLKLSYWRHYINEIKL